MVAKPDDELPLGDPEWTPIVEFWNNLRVCEEPRGTTRESLEQLERVVTECRYRSPPDLERARVATAQAIFLMRRDGETK